MPFTGTVPPGNYEVYGLIPAGLAADRPAPGIVDRWYFSTDTLVVERDTGVAWVEVARGEAAIRLAQLAERAHNSLTGVAPDQHHAAFTAADHTAIGDGAPHHARYTDAEATAVANALIAIHAALADVHHVRYTDAEASAVAAALIAIHAALVDIHHARSHDHSLAADGSPIAVAGVPNLDASKITSGRFGKSRFEWTLNKLLLGAGPGANPTEINVPDSGEGHISILPHNYNSIGQGTWAFQLDAAFAFYTVFRNTSEVNGDNISYKVYLQAGTYTLRVLHVKDNAQAIVDVDIDTTEVFSFDCYLVGSDYAAMSTQTGISIATSGLKTLKFRVDGKNASSAAYKFMPITIALWRTA